MKCAEPTRNERRLIKTVAIVEAQTLYRPFFAELLGEAGFGVVASSCQLSIQEMQATEPDIILIDIDYVTGDGLARLRALRKELPQSMLCVFTGQIEESWAISLWLAGAFCVMTKLASPADLIVGIRQATLGTPYMDPRFRE